MKGLKTILWIAGVVCLLAVIGLFLPMSTLDRMTQVLGGVSLPEGSLVVYGVRTISATFVAIGVFYIMLALDPGRYGPMVPFSGAAAVFVGLSCAVAGAVVGLPILVYLGDAAGCTIMGILILGFWNKSRQEEQTSKPSEQQKETAD